MAKSKKTLSERQIEAEQRAENAHFDAIDAEQSGDSAKAEKFRAKAQYWRDRMNLLLGNGNGIKDSHEIIMVTPHGIIDIGS